jgi:hypothetical protein
MIPAMETMLFVILLLVMIIGICLLANILYKRARHQQLALFMQRVAAFCNANNIRLGSTELIGERSVIGIDGVYRRLLFVKSYSNKKDAYILADLSQVKSCNLKRIHRTIYAAHNNAQPESYLDKISLRLEFKDDLPAEEIIFYNSDQDSNAEEDSRYRKASRWHTVISKTCGVQHTNLAVMEKLFNDPVNTTI